MEVQSNDVQIVIKNVESNGIIISNAKQFSAKEEDIKTTEYFLNIEEQSADVVEDAEAQFVTVEGDDNEYIAVEIDGSEQIILDNKEVIIFNELCRICASESDRFIPIFSGEGLEHELSEKIDTYLPLRICESDTLPLQVCYNCAATLLSWHEMVQNCVSAQQRLTEIQNKLNSKEQYYESTADDDNDNTDTAENKGVNEEAQVQSENENEIDETMQVVDVLEANRSGTSPRLLKTSENQNASEKSVSKSKTQSPKSDDNLCRVTVADFAKSSPGPEASLEGISKKDDVENAKDEPDADNAQTKGKKRKTTKESYACEECGKQFKFKDSFLRHQRIHKDERPFTCYVCGKQFRDSGGLCRHLRDVHDRVKNFECETCGRCFASKATRDDHQRTHTGERPYVCHSCGKSFKSKASLYTHSKLHTDEFPHVCLHCGRKFRRRQEMLCHVSMHTGEKNFECDICFKRFRIKTELKRHLLIHSDEKPFRCAICDFRSKQRRYLNNHIKHKHSLIERKEETNACLNLSGEIITILTAASPQPPDPLATSKQKKRRRKPPRPQGEPSWKVKKKLNSTRRLRDAPELVQRRAEAAQARVTVDGATLYKCPECEKLLSTAYNYFAHKRIHTQEKLCTCEICGKSFTASSSLTRHMREVHDKIKDFKCSYCERKLASKISRDEHERTHTDERPHVCDVCGKRFRQRASLSVHKRFHSKSTLFSCRECNRGFPRKQDMERHELTHTDQKPYACKICDRKFRSSASAIRHRQTHDGEQKHTCKTCGVSFSQRRYLKNHMKNVHNDA